MKAHYKKHTLLFKQASGTSRGILRTKDTYFIYVEENGQTEVGEAALFKGLSSDDVPHYEDKLTEVCRHIESYKNDFHNRLKQYPSIVFGLEQAFLKLKNNGVCYENSFTKGEQGIPINGLIWMGSPTFMQEQVEEKIKAGFKCIKLKIGAIDFDKEIELLQNLRKTFPDSELELRVDANGAFSVDEALEKLTHLSKLSLHSIEQPIKQGQAEAMRELCKKTPLPIALDEELIGVYAAKDKEELLNKIQPQFIILKPALVGGFASCDEWIEYAEDRNIAWWITSALESNIGLDAIAQYTANKNTIMYQGLGTGALFTNNTDSDLYIKNAALWKQIITN